MIFVFQLPHFTFQMSSFFKLEKWRVLQICLEKTQVSLFCCSLLSTFLSHIRHFTTPNGIKKKKLLLMQSYVAMLFYFFIKSKQYSCNNREKEYKIIHKWCEWKSESEILFCFPQKNCLFFWEKIFLWLFHAWHNNSSLQEHITFSLKSHNWGLTLSIQFS